MIDDLTLATLCAHGYKDGKDHKNGSIDNGYTVVDYDEIVYFKPVRDVEVVGYYLQRDKLVLSVRGTEAVPGGDDWHRDLLDLIRDLRFLPWRTDFGWGHVGFYKGAKYWMEEHRLKIPSTGDVIIVGHSMGAQIAAWMAFMLRSRVTRVMLLAEPKGFFRSSTRMYRDLGLKDITTSYINEQDWIRSLPPWGRRSVKPTESGAGSHSVKDYVDNIAKLLAIPPRVKKD